MTVKARERLPTCKKLILEPDSSSRSMHALLKLMTAVCLIALTAVLLILVRPFGVAEAWWASGAAVLLVVFRLIGPKAAIQAVGKGTDVYLVYLFLAGMMTISELARREGVFDWLAQHAVRAAKGSMSRLFVLVYGSGILVTVLLSNDATAVVLTPAVLAAVRAAEAEPLPYLFICAFIANAASFVLPISNPANLVVYNGHMPSLPDWLRTFGLPSVASIAATFLVLRWMARELLRGQVKQETSINELSAAAKLTLWSIGVLAAALLTASTLKRDLGLPAFVCGLAAVLGVTVRDRRAVGDVARHISWSVLPLVAGLCHRGSGECDGRAGGRRDTAEEFARPAGDPERRFWDCASFEPDE